MTIHFGHVGNRSPGQPQAGGATVDSFDAQLERSPESRIRLWASAAIIFTLILVSLMGILAWRSTRQGEESELRVVHTLTVDQALESGLGHAISSEAQARAFAATGKQTFLDAKLEHQEELARDVAAVRRLTLDNASQQSRLDLLEPKMKAINQFEKNVDGEMLLHGKSPSDHVLLEQGRLLNDVRFTFGEMRREEARLMKLRVAKTEQTAELTRTTILTGTLIAVASLIFAEALILFQIKRSIRIQKRLRAEELESAESRRAEGLALESSRYVRSLIEACLDPLVTISREGKITDVNDAAAKVTGISRASLIGSDFSDFFTDPQSARRGYEQAFAEGAVKNHPLSIRDAEGNVTDVLYNASVFRDESGHVQGVFAAARDITERKRAEAALRQSEERFRRLIGPVKEYASNSPSPGWLPNEFETGDGMSEMLCALFEGNPDMVFVSNAKGQIIGANPSAVSGFGYSREQLEGQSPSMLLPVAARERHEGHMQGFQTHRSIRTMGTGMDLKGRNAKGEEFPVDVMLYPFSAGNVQYTIAVCRRLDAALARSQMQVHAIVENVREYTINLLDPNGRILTWNEGSRRIHGMSATEALGKNYSIFFTTGQVADGEPERLLEEAARKGHCHATGWRVGIPESLIWAEVDLTAIRDSTGQLTGFSRVLHDMTAHKKAEDALRQLNRELIESEERFRLLVDPVKEYAIYMLDPHGSVKTWNAGAERIKGYKAEEILGRNFSAFFLPEDIDAGTPAAELEFAVRDGRFETEGWRLRKDGSKFWALVTLTPAYGQDGLLRGFAKVTRDLTAQKEAEDALRSLNAQLERYRIFVENIDEYAVYTMDAEGMITSWGTGAQKVSGARPEEVMGRHYSMFFPPEEALAGVPQKELDEAAQNGRHMTDAWMITPDGRRRWSSGVLNAVRDETGQLTGFIRVARDMTRQKLLEESLEQLAAELESRVAERTRQLEANLIELRHKNEEVEAFVYIVSHDLRAPLVNLMGFARELQSSCARLRSLVDPCVLPEVQKNEVSEILSEDLPSALRFISQSSLKFERLIDALLMLSRHGRQNYTVADLDVGEVVANAVAIFQQVITEAGATVDVGYLPPVKADLTAMGQVFSNLIGNSLKYRSPERPLRLEIGGRFDEGSVTYWVRDNGLGIPETGKARLFQVFQRFHPQRAQGDGMGLAIVHRIVERHGGRIWAESREGDGTTFYFSLPSNRQSRIPGSDENVIQEAVVHGRD